MKFSVVIPLYNKERYILRAISSILNQTHTDFELIVVDDGSTDEGMALVAKVDDSRVKIVRQRNGGEAAARNRGIQEATSPYIAFLDADDAWKEDHLSLLAMLIEDFPDAGLYCTGYRFVEPSGRAKEPRWRNVPERGYVPRYFRSVSEGDLIATASSVCIPRAVFQQLGLFPVGDRLGADQDMWARIALRYPLAVDARSTATYFRDAGDRSCTTIRIDTELPYLTRLQQALDSCHFPDELRADVEAYIRHGLFSFVSVNVRSGHYETALRLLQDSRLQERGMRFRIWMVLAKLPPGLSGITLKIVDAGRTAYRLLGEASGRRHA